MAAASDFTTELEAKVAQQLKSQRVGYLLGAGSSYLNGNGYPLAFELWDRIKGSIADAGKRDDIQAKLDGGANGIEDALDLLDDGGAADTPYRHLVTAALAELFMAKTPLLDLHGEFVRRIAQHADPCVKVFSLNYDPLIERAAESVRVRLIDGFLGHEQAFFNSAVFSESFSGNPWTASEANDASCGNSGAPLQIARLAWVVRVPNKRGMQVRVLTKPTRWSSSLDGPPAAPQSVRCSQSTVLAAVDHLSGCDGSGSEASQSARRHRIRVHGRACQRCD